MDITPILFTNGKICVFENGGLNSEKTGILNHEDRKAVYTLHHKRFEEVLFSLKDTDWFIAEFDSWQHPISFPNVLLMLGMDHLYYKWFVQPQSEESQEDEEQVVP